MASLAYSVVELFEKTIAEYAGSLYGVAVESGTAAIFLSLEYRKHQLRQALPMPVRIPSHTYPSVPASIMHAGGTVQFDNRWWTGTYELEPYEIHDGALRFSRGMYQGGLHCLSFHAKKLLPIGRGGMILTNDRQAYLWLKLARFDGRDEVPLDQDNLTVLGWNMYLTPEQAARGLQLFDMIKAKILPDLRVEKQDYPDLSKFAIYRRSDDKPTQSNDERHAEPTAVEE